LALTDSAHIVCLFVDGQLKVLESFLEVDSGTKTTEPSADSGDPDGTAVMHGVLVEGWRPREVDHGRSRAGSSQYGYQAGGEG
jgi:hypothetical protein